MFSQKVKAPALKKVTGVVLICIAPVIFMGSRSRDNASVQLDEVDKSPAAGSTTEADNISWYQHAYDTAWHQLPFVVAGSIAGFSQGFIGVGGGLVMTTLMTVGTDLSQHTIIATALSATTLINTSATVIHYRMGHVCYPLTLQPLLPFLLLLRGAPCACLVLSQLPLKPVGLRVVGARASGTADLGGVGSHRSWRILSRSAD